MFYTKNLKKQISHIKLTKFFKYIDLQGVLPIGQLSTLDCF